VSRPDAAADSTAARRRTTLRLAVLDMAGTTIAATDHVPAALVQAFAEAGLTLEESAVSAVRGRSKRDAVSRLVAELGVPEGERAALGEEIHATFRRLLHARFRQGVTPIPGAENTIRRLRELGWAVVLTTGFDREITDVLLGVLGWTGDFVDAVICGDDVARGRPAPDPILEAMARTGVTDPAAVAVVGDTIADLQSAAAARAGCIVGVLSGAHAREQLVAQPHTVILPGIADFPDWLEAQT
jgi:phosphonatase-like hydrolase